MSHPHVKEKALSEAQPESYFRLSNGKELKSLRDLVEALKTMDEGTFQYHVNDQKNDFSNWIRDVFTDEWLAFKILRIQDRDKMWKVIIKRIHAFERPPSAARHLINKATEKIKENILPSTEPETKENEKAQSQKSEPDWMPPEEVAPKKDAPPVMEQNRLRSFLVGIIIGIVTLVVFLFIFTFLLP